MRHCRNSLQHCQLRMAEAVQTHQICLLSIASLGTVAVCVAAMMQEDLSGMLGRCGHLQSLAAAVSESISRLVHSQLIASNIPCLRKIHDFFATAGMCWRWIVDWTFMVACLTLGQELTHVTYVPHLSSDEGHIGLATIATLCSRDDRSPPLEGYGARLHSQSTVDQQHLSIDPGIPRPSCLKLKASLIIFEVSLNLWSFSRGSIWHRAVQHGNPMEFLSPCRLLNWTVKIGDVRLQAHVTTLTEALPLHQVRAVNICT